MLQVIKAIGFLNLSAEPKTTIDSMPPSASDDLQLAPGVRFLCKLNVPRISSFTSCSR